MARPSPQTERLVEIIDMLADVPGSGRSLAEIARHLDINKATIYPMISELVNVGWLIRHPKTKILQLGPRLGAIGKSAEAGIDIVDFARPRTLELAQSLDATCMLMSARSHGIMVMDVTTGSIQARQRNIATNAFGLRPGDVIANSPPNAAVFVAWSDNATQTAWVKQGTARGQETEHHLDLQRILDSIHEQGYAVHHFQPAPNTLGELVTAATGNRRASQRAKVIHQGGFGPTNGLRLLNHISPTAEYYPVSISAPIFDGDGQVVHAILVTDLELPISGHLIGEIAQKVMVTAKSIEIDSGQHLT